jgi:uncharacterized protein (TIGR03437 family)
VQRNSPPVWRFRLLILPLAAACLISCAVSQAAVGLKVVASGFNLPVFVTSSGDGSGRLFVVEQGGTIRIISGGARVATPFLDITDRVTSGGEMGLLGLAFHPNVRSNGRFFVNYDRTVADQIQTVIAEYTASPPAANLVSKDSERILLTFSQPFENHKGGMLAFGPDGYLYIATGDGGSGGDPFGNGQNLGTLLGKILRIDVDSPPPSGQAYAIPPDNPFVGKEARGEIWAYGLRNPWRFSFDRLTGRLYAGDVGQDLWEEIDNIAKGGNYGWNRMEGKHCYPPLSDCDKTGLILPVYEYGHDVGSSVIGGYFYHGKAVSSLSGRYLFGDNGSGRIWSLSLAFPLLLGVGELLNTGLSISSFGEDEDGELYIAELGGTVRQIIGTGVTQPSVIPNGVVNAASFLSQFVAPGEIVTIFGTGIGPEQGAGARLNSSGLVDNFVANTRVLFDGIAAPLFYVQASQINAQAPYKIDGKFTTTMQVEYNGVLTAPVTLPVGASSPAIFAVSGGIGRAAALNQDSSPNSSSNPAPRGSIVTFFATGEGQTVPLGVDGKPSASPYPMPALPVSVTIGGVPADVLFAGSAPGFAGLLQVNARVPTSVAPGNGVPVAIAIGDKTSQPGITIAVN